MSNILIHFPSRERPDQLRRALSQWKENVYDHENTKFIVSLDSDDPKLMEYDEGIIGESGSKINAINRDVDIEPWDILVVASDDLVIKTPKFDKYIREEFKENMPDLDGVLFAKDGFNSRIPCHPIIGRAFYQRFGYVFHPSYRSFFCDDELGRVATKLKKLHRTDKIKFAHMHPSARTRSVDALDRKNKLHFQADKNNFLERGKLGFP